MTPSCTATAWSSSTMPCGSIGTTKPASISRSQGWGAIAVMRCGLSVRQVRTTVREDAWQSRYGLRGLEMRSAWLAMHERAGAGSESKTKDAGSPLRGGDGLIDPEPKTSDPRCAGMTAGKPARRPRAVASLDPADVLAAAGVDLDDLFLADEQRHPDHGAGFQGGRLAAAAGGVAAHAGV